MDIIENNYLKIALTFCNLFMNYFHGLIPDSIDPSIVQDVRVTKGEVEYISLPETIKINSCDISSGEVKFSLSNSFFVMHYRLKGQMQGRAHNKPEINKILLSEKFVIKNEATPDLFADDAKKLDSKINSFQDLVESTNQRKSLLNPVQKDVVAEISVFPISSHTYDPNYNSEIIHFDLTIQKKTKLMQWNENLYYVKCGDFTKEVKVDLHK